ncbi:hypothetical protein BJY00DRAFT_310344 [Aspergillus carlsbadensis]|nr:hypothetical protein BJY00DRAFT_310344 [Aspergillus carlsbadensis]
MELGEKQQWADKKRIILCADGTWTASNRGNSTVPSNVAKLARAIATTGLESQDPVTERETVVKQIVFYQSGLGSGDFPIERALSGGFGWGLEDDVCQIYDFISNNYEQGDELFFFGFSRGAFTVRSVAGLVSDVGVLSADQMSSFAGLWEAYRDNTSGGPFSETEWYKKHGAELKTENVPIKVVGVWDTVGALGIPEWSIVKFAERMGLPINKKYQFHNTRLSKNIAYAFQALALDEPRLVFPPAIWFETADGGPSEKLCQCWFPGVHGNIGGTAREPIGDNAFAWMAGFPIFPAFAQWTDLNLVDGYERMTGANTNWGCWKINDEGGLLSFFGKTHRTPGEYEDTTRDENSEPQETMETFETFHPMVRHRKANDNKWRPGSLEGFVEDQASRNPRRWRKDNAREICVDDVMFGNDKKMVVAHVQRTSVTFGKREKLSRELCPVQILGQLESTR